MLEKLKKILSEYLGGAEEIALDAVLVSDLDMDSMQLYDVVCTIEDHFEIEIPDRALQKFVTVRDVVEYLEEAA